MNKNIQLSLVVAASIAFGGCAAVTGHSGAMNDFNKVALSNSCDFKNIDEKIEKKDDVILWGEQGGSLARNCMNYEKSNTLFDAVEQEYKEEVDKDNIANNTLETAGSVLVNNNINDYEGNTYEKVMVNTYKALNYASLGDHANARVEFNRALDRQRRAKEYFEKEIKEQKEKIEKDQKEFTKKENKKLEQQKENSAKGGKEQQAKSQPQQSPSQVASNQTTQKVVYDQFKATLEGFEAYPDFINPFTTYISGIYFMLNNDNKKARDLLKESLGMDSDNAQIKSDFELSDKLSKNVLSNKDEKYTWVIYENGQSMYKDERKFHIPLFLVTSKAHYTGIALPDIKEKPASHTYLEVNGSKTQEICNMDNVIKTEFKKRFDGIVTEAIINTTVKTYAQYQLQKNGGLFAGIAGAIYQGVTNKADVRSWTTLPKSFQSARVKNDGAPIEIKNDKGEIIKTVEIPQDKNAIIYVKSATPALNNIHKIVF